jgi:UDP-4-amino-4-deoxy-L-arabinose formyltransferase / UDP-glucuronic acid dehydrogenase (UDP-4-keto-hexauronic acid decarboxylating)
MKVVVFGYNILGLMGFKKLLENDIEILALVTHEDDPDEKIYFDSVADFAKSKNIQVFTPKSPNTDEFIDILKSFKPDAIFSFYYRNMISQKILDIVNGNAYNLHGSLLPKFRGRCPVNWALLFGETETGVTLHKMVKKADKGDIVDQEGFPVLINDTAKTLQPKMEKAAAILLDRTLPLLRDGKATFTVQNEDNASYFGGRKPEDGIIDWNKTAIEIHNLIRAVADPFPGAYSESSLGKLIIWSSKFIDETGCGEVPGIITSLSPMQISTGKGRLEIINAQLNDSGIMSGNDLAEKLSLSVGTKV